MPTLAPHRRFFYPTGLARNSLAGGDGRFVPFPVVFQSFPFNAHKGWTVLIAVASVGVVLMLVWFAVALVF